MRKINKISNFFLSIIMRVWDIGDFYDNTGRRFVKKDNQWYICDSDID